MDGGTRHERRRRGGEGLRAARAPVHVPDGDAFVHATGDEFERFDPATGALVTVARESTAVDIDAACGRARAVVEGRAWGTDGARRSRVLHEFARAMLVHGEELAELLTREQGKTLAEARIEVGALGGHGRLLRGPGP